MKMEKKKKPYSKPRLRTIGLETKEVLAGGCKTMGAPIGAAPPSCGLFSTPCVDDGS